MTNLVLCGWCGRKLPQSGACPKCHSRRASFQVLGFGLALLGLTLLFSGCCKKQICPAVPPPRIITVQRHCDLPPLQLPAFKRATKGCPAEHVCFDKANAGQLYLRLARLKDFAKAARTRCGSLPASQPTSQPTSRPAP